MKPFFTSLDKFIKFKKCYLKCRPELQLKMLNHVITYKLNAKNLTKRVTIAHVNTFVKD